MKLAHYSNPSYRRAFRWTILVDQWFDDCVQGRDGWKAYFSDLEQTGANSAYVIYGIIGKSAVVISDFTLGYMHRAFQNLSRKTLKQLDKDADQSAVLLSGSEAFAESLRILELTTTAWQLSQFQLLNLDSLPLADNFVDDIATQFNQEEKGDLTNIRVYMPISWNYHSDIHDRIDYASHEDIAGIFHLETPGSELFKNFRGICKSVTPLYYRECGIEFSLSSLKPVIVNITQKTAEDAYKIIIDDYTSTTFSPAIVWDVADTSMFSKMGSARICNVLNTSINKFRNHLPTYQDAHIHFPSVQKDVLANKLLQLRLEKGYVTQEQILHQTENGKSQKTKFDNQTVTFHEYSRCIGLRLAAAVLLDTKKSTLVKTLTLLSCLQQLFQLQEPIMKGHELSILITGIKNHLQSNQEIELKTTLDLYTKKLEDINRYVVSTLSRLPGSLKNVDTISGYLRDQMKRQLQPELDDISKSTELFALLEEEFCSLNIVVTGRLVEYATKNEFANDIEPVRLVVRPDYNDGPKESKQTHVL